jgi:hypothetical protein
MGWKSTIEITRKEAIQAIITPEEGKKIVNNYFMITGGNV